MWHPYDRLTCVWACVQRGFLLTVLRSHGDWLACSFSSNAARLHLHFFFFLMQLHYSEQSLGSKSIVMSFPDRLPATDFLRDWGKNSPPSTAMTCRRYATVFPSVRVASVRVAATALQSVTSSVFSAQSEQRCVSTVTIPSKCRACVVKAVGVCCLWHDEVN